MELSVTQRMKEKSCNFNDYNMDKFIKVSILALFTVSILGIPAVVHYCCGESRQEVCCLPEASEQDCCDAECDMDWGAEGESDCCSDELTLKSFQTEVPLESHCSSVITTFGLRAIESSSCLLTGNEEKGIKALCRQSHPRAGMSHVQPLLGVFLI